MMLTMIDFWLLWRLEKFAYWWQKLIGKNCFWLSRVFIVWGAINLIAPNQLAILEGRRLAWSILATLIVLISATGLWRQSKRNENKVSRMSEQGYANPLKITNFYFRMIWLLLAIFAVIVSLIFLFGHHPFQALDVFFSLNYTFSWVLYEYFLACDSLPPPAKSKIKEWKERFVNAVKWIFVPDPQPSPVPCE